MGTDRESTIYFCQLKHTINEQKSKIYKNNFLSKAQNFNVANEIQ